MPTTVHYEFQDAWVFAGMRSSLWPEVERVFLIPNKGKPDEGRIGVALGYPTPEGDRDFRAVDYTEMADINEVTGREVCCVSAFEFTCLVGVEHHGRIIMHYDLCNKAANDVGTDIKMDLAEHAELHQWWMNSMICTLPFRKTCLDTGLGNLACTYRLRLRVAHLICVQYVCLKVSSY